LLSHYRFATPIALFILACSIITLLATARLKDKRNQDISEV
jgi:hypothetical protein